MRMIILLLFSLTGCASMPGGVSVYDSRTDNVQQISMSPGWLSNSAFKLGLYRSSDMPVDTVIMTVSSHLNAVSTKEGLTINIDGKRTILSSIDDLSDVDQNGFFNKRFVVKMDFVKQMIAGTKVWVKASFVGQSMIEDEFSNDRPMSAKRGFVNFLTTLDGRSKSRTPSSQ